MRVKGRSPGFCPGSPPAAKYFRARRPPGFCSPPSILCGVYPSQAAPGTCSSRPPVAAGVAAPTGGCAAAPPAAG